MNNVTLSHYDKKQNLGSLIVNNQSVNIGQIDGDGWDEKNSRAVRVFAVMVTYDFNISNPVTFKAKTIKGIIGQMQRCKHNLVKF